MIHLRIIAPAALADEVVEQLRCSRSNIDIVHLRAVTLEPDGDLVNLRCPARGRLGGP